MHMYMYMYIWWYLTIPRNSNLPEVVLHQSVLDKNCCMFHYFELCCVYIRLTVHLVCNHNLIVLSCKLCVYLSSSLQAVNYSSKKIMWHFVGTILYGVNQSNLAPKSLLANQQNILGSQLRGKESNYIVCRLSQASYTKSHEDSQYAV